MVKPRNASIAVTRGTPEVGVIVAVIVVRVYGRGTVSGRVVRADAAGDLSAAFILGTFKIVIRLSEK